MIICFQTNMVARWNLQKSMVFWDFQEIYLQFQVKTSKTLLRTYKTYAHDQCKFRLSSGNQKRDGQTDGKTNRQTDGHGLHLMPRCLRWEHTNMLIESVVIIIIKGKHLPLHVEVVLAVFFLPDLIFSNISSYFTLVHITLFLLDSRISNNLLVNFCSDVCGASAMFSDKVWSDHFIMYFWWVHFNIV